MQKWWVVYYFPPHVSFSPDLSLCGGAVEAEVLSLKVAVQRETVKNQSCVWRWRLGVLLLMQTHEKQQIDI